MLESLKAQLSMPTFMLLAVVGWLTWVGIGADRVNRALIADFHQHHLENITSDECGTLTYRSDEVFPKLCIRRLTQIDPGFAGAMTGHYFRAGKGAAPTFAVDDRYIRADCYDVACRIIENFPEGDVARNWSEARGCWLQRNPESPSASADARQADPRIEPGTSLQTYAPASLMAVSQPIPTFHPVPTFRPVQAHEQERLGRLASTDC